MVLCNGAAARWSSTIEGPDGPELRVSADAELRVDGLDVVSTLEDLESRLSTIEGLCVNDTAVEDDGL